MLMISLPPRERSCHACRSATVTLPNGRQFRLPRVRAVCAIHQLRCLSPGNLRLRRRCAAQCRSSHLLLGQPQFLCFELGMEQQIHREVVDLVGVCLQRIPRERGRVIVSAGFDMRGFRFQQIVHGIAVHLFVLPLVRHVCP